MVLISATNCILNRITFHLFLGASRDGGRHQAITGSWQGSAVLPVYTEHITPPVVWIWILWIALFDILHINLPQYLHIGSVDTSECAGCAGQEPDDPSDRSVCIAIKISPPDTRLDHGATGSCNAVNTSCRCASAVATSGETLRWLLVKVKSAEKGSSKMFKIVWL